jgi:outer membrane protein W
MKRVVAVLFALFVVAPLFAQRPVELIVDVEGVRRSNRFEFEPNTVRYEPQFDNGGGAGIGINWFFGRRTSLELKAAVLDSKLTVRRMGSDFVANADVGHTQIYPLTAILQWHMLENGAIRPYVGAGAGYVILKNVERRFIGATGIEFDDPVGLVVNGGVRIPFSKRFSATADARYTPIETQAKATFTGTESSVKIDVKPLVVSFGIAYHF